MDSPHQHDLGCERLYLIAISFTSCLGPRWMKQGISHPCPPHVSQHSPHGTEQGFKLVSVHQSMMCHLLQTQRITSCILWPQVHLRSIASLWPEFWWSTKTCPVLFLYCYISPNRGVHSDTKLAQINKLIQTDFVQKFYWSASDWFSAEPVKVVCEQSTCISYNIHADSWWKVCLMQQSCDDGQAHR